MDFLYRLFGTSRAEHSITITAAAAAAFKRNAKRERLNRRYLCLVVGRLPNGRFSISLMDDPRLLRSDQNAVATSNGIVIVVSRGRIPEFADLVIDFQHGAFCPSGSAFPKTVASDPGGIELSRSALLEMSPHLRDDDDAVERIAWHVQKGDSRAARLLSVAPPVVAAYTDELDAVALLSFPDHLQAATSLKPGAKLLTVNLYEFGNDTASDLVRGEKDLHRYRNFIPIIADFLAEDSNRVASRKAGIEAGEWERTLLLGREALIRARGRFRNGCPPESGKPAY
jgi:hypothetical protein